MDSSVAKTPSPDVAVESFISEILWQDDEPDCLVICCSDHRFEQQIRDLARHLKFKRPHVLQVPSGAVLSLPLTSAFNFLSKAIDKIIERVVEMKHVKEIVLVGHADCGAYKADKVPLLANVVQRFTGKSIYDLQRDHLAQAARRLHIGIRGVTVRPFFADVVGEGTSRRVRFVEVPEK